MTLTVGQIDLDFAFSKNSYPGPIRIVNGNSYSSSFSVKKLQITATNGGGTPSSPVAIHFEFFDEKGGRTFLVASDEVVIPILRPRFSHETEIEGYGHTIIDSINGKSLLPPIEVDVRRAVIMSTGPAKISRGREHLMKQEIPGLKMLRKALDGIFGGPDPRAGK